jgi:hypothetical protein
MRRILFAAACALGLGLTADAARAHEFHGSAGAPVAYHHEHAVRFGGGYYYPGRQHHHWSQHCWDPVHRRYHDYDPYLRVWFWWCPAANCYYPDSYCP